MARLRDGFETENIGVDLRIYGDKLDIASLTLFNLKDNTIYFDLGKRELIYLIGTLSNALRKIEEIEAGDEITTQLTIEQN